MARIRLHPGQSVGLPLTDTERKIVCDSLVIPDEYIARFRDNLDKPDVLFTLDELDDLMGYVAVEASHSKNKQRQNILDGVGQRINDLLALYTDEDTQTDEDEA